MTGNVTENGAAGEQTSSHDDGLVSGLKSSTTSESGFDGAVDEPTPLTSVTPVRPVSSHRSVTQASLTTSDEGLLLYELTDKKGSSKGFSAHCIKTVLDLKLLGIGCDRQRLTFSEVRSTLSAKVGNPSVTVPTLELADGTHLTDSWTIALYLADKHPSGKALFPTTTSRPFASLLNTFGDTTLASHLRPFTRLAVHEKLDKESAEYFADVKIGKTRLDKIRSLSVTEKSRHIQACVDALELLQVSLSSAKQQAPASQTPVWLEGGLQPTHADFVVYGWYVHSRAAGPSLVREIWHAHPLVGKWITDLDAWAGPDITADYY